MFALLATPARFDAWFHPAPLNQRNRPMVPPPDLFREEQIVVAAQVVPGGAGVDALFEVQGLEEEGKRLTLRYRFFEPAQKADFWMKAYLAVRIPRKNYERVVFVENGREVGALNARDGEWSQPEPVDDAGRVLARDWGK
jgi:hypothetical protein